MTVMEHRQDLWSTPFLRRIVSAPTGFNDDLVATIRAHQNLVQGDTIGMVICHSRRNQDAPSISAASISEVGTSWRPER